MNDKKIKSDIFVIAFDKERERVFNRILNAALKGSLSIDLVDSLKKDGLHKVLVQMLEEVSNQTHARGWCDDPNCPIKNGED